MTTPQEYVRRPERVQAMRYTAETCEALHEWLGLTHEDDADCDSWIEVQLPDGETVQLRPGGWVFVDPATREIVDALTDDECRARYVPAGGLTCPECRRPTGTATEAVGGGVLMECGECCAQWAADAIESALPDAVAAGCVKAPHSGSGYLHEEGDDSPFMVDGVAYCGRCHCVLPHAETAAEKAAAGALTLPNLTGNEWHALRDLADAMADPDTPHEREAADKLCEWVHANRAYLAGQEG